MKKLRSGNSSSPKRLSLMPLEPETSRSVVILRRTDQKPVGAGLLVSAEEILTCGHVVNAALPTSWSGDRCVEVLLVGVVGQPTFLTTISRPRTPEDDDLSADLTVLAIGPADAEQLAIRPVELAAPISHTGKPFAVLGYPDGRPYGVHASGVLRGAERKGLVQMDGNAQNSVAPGFSGSPVWCPSLQAFVGIVVARDGQWHRDVAWCIPSRILCRFHPTLRVKFRIPREDRPVIHDYEEDDPNRELFGQSSFDGQRSLTAFLRNEQGRTRADLRYECIEGESRGGFVTFITYPDFCTESEDAYELFAPVVGGVAETYFYPRSPFTVAAIGDGGDSALTLDLASVAGSAEAFGVARKSVRRAIKKRGGHI